MDEDDSLNRADTQRMSFRPSIMEPDSLLDEKHSHFDKGALDFTDSSYREQSKSGGQRRSVGREADAKPFDVSSGEFSLFDGFDRTFLHQAAI